MRRFRMARRRKRVTAAPVALPLRIRSRCASPTNCVSCSSATWRVAECSYSARKARTSSCKASLSFRSRRRAVAPPGRSLPAGAACTGPQIEQDRFLALVIVMSRALDVPPAAASGSCWPLARSASEARAATPSTPSRSRSCRLPWRGPCRIIGARPPRGRSARPRPAAPDAHVVRLAIRLRSLCRRSRNGALDTAARCLPRRIPVEERRGIRAPGFHHQPLAGPEQEPFAGPHEMVAPVVARPAVRSVERGPQPAVGDPHQPGLARAQCHRTAGRQLPGAWRGRVRIEIDVCMVRLQFTIRHRMIGGLRLAVQ